MGKLTDKFAEEHYSKYYSGPGILLHPVQSGSTEGLLGDPSHPVLSFTVGKEDTSTVLAHEIAHAIVKRKPGYRLAVPEEEE